MVHLFCKLNIETKAKELNMTNEERIKELEEIIRKGIEKCQTWTTSTDGSHGMCLDHNGVFKARKELKELTNG